MQKLIFVYNVNSGIANTILGISHKLFSPKTYSCNLCAITFDTFSESKIWKAFRKETKLDMQFLHINEFITEYKGSCFIYPVILSEGNNGIELFLEAEEINLIHSTEALITVLKTKLRLAPH